jgi:hypothetical protein
MKILDKKTWINIINKTLILNKFKINFFKLMLIHQFLFGIIIADIISYTYSKCGLHELMKRNLKKGTVNLWSDKKRFLQKESWTPLRIYIDYTTLESQSDLADQSLLKNIKIVLDKVSSTFTNLVSVKASPNNLNITECYTTYPIIISETVKKGVGADLVIFPYIDKNLETSTEAVATFCKTDSVTHRPTAGFIALNENLSFSKINSMLYIELLLLHEINHILSFNYDLFSTFIDSQGEKIPSSKVYANFTVNGENRTMIITPKVVQAARKYYGCDTLEGVELEDQGGSGSAWNHWEQRVMAGDFMISQSYEENSISPMTLALMEDSGWYNVNYYTGGLFRFGKGRGCQFLNSKCVNNGKTNFPNEFFLNINQKVCFSGRTAKGKSSLQKDLDDIPKNNQYFSDTRQGGRFAADYCPIAIATHVENYFLGSSCNYGISDLSPSLGEVMGPNSFCFISSLTSQNDNSIIEYKGIKHPICFPVDCDSNNLSYNVKVGNLKLKCPSGGGRIFADGYDGYLVCPDYNLICTSSVPCSDPLDCVEKRSLELEAAKFELNRYEFETADSRAYYIKFVYVFIVSLVFIF